MQNEPNDDEDENESKIDYKEVYLKKEKENKEFLARIDNIIAEQETELNKINQENKEKTEQILELEEQLNEAKNDLKIKDERIIEISDEHEEAISNIKVEHQQEMESLKNNMKKLKKQWESDIMDQVKKLETDWKQDLERAHSKNKELTESYDAKILELQKENDNHQDQAIQNEKLLHEIQQLQTTIDTLQNEKADYQNKCEDMSSKFIKMESE